MRKRELVVRRAELWSGARFKLKSGIGERVRDNSTDFSKPL